MRLRDDDGDWSIGRQDSLQTAWRWCFGCNLWGGYLESRLYIVILSWGVATYRPSSCIVTIKTYVFLDTAEVKSLII